VRKTEARRRTSRTVDLEVGSTRIDVGHDVRARVVDLVADRTGLDLDDVALVVALVLQAGQQLDAARLQVEEALLPPLAQLRLLPDATVAAARRTSQLRLELLEGGAFTYDDLAELRGPSYAAVRAWVHRNREQNRLFTVEYEDRTIVPAVCLDDALEPRPELQGPIEALRAVGEDGWALWAWLATPSAWLGGEVPAELARLNAARVADAARRRASNAA
jgi:hypothetical protein